MKKDTYLSRYLKQEQGFIDLWNNQPNRDEFCAVISGSVLRPYMFYYMAKYPNGGIPAIKIRYRNRKFK